MYLPNKYTKWYYQIITHAEKRLNISGYTERHHIIPKSLGGSNEALNIVELTPKEHYVCHLLLTKMVGKEQIRKMWYAHYMMMRGIKRYKPSSRMYELARKNMVKANKDRPGPNLGKPMPESTKKKISESLRGRVLPPMTEEHKQKLRKPKSEDHKKKISEARKGKTYGYKHSDETRKKISESNRGKKMPPKTEEWKQSHSEKLSGRKHSAEHVMKRTQSRIGIPRSEETKQKLRIANLGKKASVETRQKMSESHKRTKINT